MNVSSHCVELLQQTWHSAERGRFTSRRTTRSFWEPSVSFCQTSRVCISQSIRYFKCMQCFWEINRETSEVSWFEFPVMIVGRSLISLCFCSFQLCQKMSLKWPKMLNQWLKSNRTAKTSPSHPKPLENRHKLLHHRQGSWNHHHGRQEAQGTICVHLFMMLKLFKKSWYRVQKLSSTRDQEFFLIKKKNLRYIYIWFFLNALYVLTIGYINLIIFIIFI